MPLFKQFLGLSKINCAIYTLHNLDKEYHYLLQSIWYRSSYYTFYHRTLGLNHNWGYEILSCTILGLSNCHMTIDPVHMTTLSLTPSVSEQDH